MKEFTFWVSLTTTIEAKNKSEAIRTLKSNVIDDFDITDYEIIEEK